jgi:hypothetical protein
MRFVSFCFIFPFLDIINKNISKGVDAEQDTDLNKNSLSEELNPEKQPHYPLKISTKLTKLYFEISRTFDVEIQGSVVKHKKFGNKRTRKVLKRINLISKLRKKAKTGTVENIVEHEVNEEEETPIVHVESLRNSISSIDSISLEVPIQSSEAFQNKFPSPLHQGK